MAGKGLMFRLWLEGEVQIMNRGLNQALKNRQTKEWNNSLFDHIPGRDRMAAFSLLCLSAAAVNLKKAQRFAGLNDGRVRLEISGKRVRSFEF